MLPEYTVTPFGPLVVPLTWPLPAVTDADMLPRPLPDRVTVQVPVPFDALPVTTVLLPLELPTLTELLTCASAIGAYAIGAPRPKSAKAIAEVFKVPSCIRAKRGSAARLPGTADPGSCA